MHWFCLFSTVSTLSCTQLLFWEALGLIWRKVRARAQKPRLGGHFLAPSYKEFDLKIKNLIFLHWFCLFSTVSTLSCTQLFFWEALGLIWRKVRAGAQKPRLGGHFLAPSYKEFDLKIKIWFYCTDFVSFQLFPLYLVHSYFFWEALVLIWRTVRAGAQKLRLGGVTF